jgi:carbamoyltransferase
MRILGLSAFYHDAGACLVEDGRIVAAAQEERYTRRKHDAAFPTRAIDACLAQAGLRPRDLDHVVFYDKPFLKFERLLETYLAFAPRGLRQFLASAPAWIKDKLFQKSHLVRRMQGAWGKDVDWRARLLFSEHHYSHAASAFYPSPFERAAVLTLDGVGEWTTTSLALGQGSDLKVLREIHFPHSIGLLYSAFTYYTGFKVNSGEYKVMGLAPYGEPVYADLIRKHLVDLRPDGSFRLDMRYFDYCTGMTMTNARFHALFGGPPRRPESELRQRDMDLAASVQAVCEDMVLALAKGIARETREKYLCLAGGVALNCVANGKLLRAGVFEDLWIQPAAGDAGGALGAALAAWHELNPGRRVPEPGDSMRGAFLGPQYAQADIEARLAAMGARFEVLDDDALLDACADALASGQAVGWHQGRMEFGPRALGGRSILADARSPAMQKQLNLKVKYRESFRPFAPSVPREDVAQWFELDHDSPYMLLVADVRPEHRTVPADPSAPRGFGLALLNEVRSTIPAVTHLDYSARVQTVHAETNPRYHALLRRFAARTGCPVLVNTSFNVRGEPIVESPEDAFRCFMGTGLDALAVGNCWLRKDAQDPEIADRYPAAVGDD